MKKSSFDPAALDRAVDGVTLRSDDGRLFYWLRSTGSGLWVQRDRRHKENGTRLVQSSVFSSEQDFIRWCDADTVRFDYPIVHLKLQREGYALLRGQGPSHDAA